MRFDAHANYVRAGASQHISICFICVLSAYYFKTMLYHTHIFSMQTRLCINFNVIHVNSNWIANSNLSPSNYIYFSNDWRVLLYMYVLIGQIKQEQRLLIRGKLLICSWSNKSSHWARSHWACKWILQLCCL